MLARNLDFAPAAEDLPKTAKVMTHDLFRFGYTDDDSERIARAIDEAGRTYSRFPTIFHIKQHILSRGESEFRNNKALPKEVELTPEQKLQRIKRKDEEMKKIRAILKKKTKHDEEYERKKEARELIAKERVNKNSGSIYDVMPDHIAKQQDELQYGKGIRTPEEIEKDL